MFQHIIYTMYYLWNSPPLSQVALCDYKNKTLHLHFLPICNHLRRFDFSNIFLLSQKIRVGWCGGGGLEKMMSWSKRFLNSVFAVNLNGTLDVMISSEVKIVVFLTQSVLIVYSVFKRRCTEHTMIYPNKFANGRHWFSTVVSRREQYYWVRYWYWVILGCFRTIAIGIGIVKGFSKYWYWVLLRAFQSIGIGIGYC